MVAPGQEPAAEMLRRQADEVIEAHRAYVASPAFQHSVGLAVLTKIASDDSAPIRERRRAAEVLAKLRLQAMTALAQLAGAREQSLDTLGLSPNPQAMALTQINQRVEIVRAADWRAARSVDDGEPVQALEQGDGEDPPA